MIHWNVKPEMLEIGPLTLRWYGLLFAAGFVIGIRLLEQMFDQENISKKSLDRLFIYMIIATMLGARLGHTLFYEPEIYLADPLRILKIWEGGLASHGAVVGILLAMYWFSKRHGFQFFWLMDRVVIPIALAGSLIRLGNLMNSEIIGRASTLPWAFVFERVDQIPRHPAQIYEALAYLVIFFVLRKLYSVPKFRNASGLIVSAFAFLIFLARFLIEFSKENQVSFESQLPLDLGQLFSLPLILGGAYGIFFHLRKLSAAQARKGEALNGRK